MKSRYLAIPPLLFALLFLCARPLSIPAVAGRAMREVIVKLKADKDDPVAVSRMVAPIGRVVVRIPSEHAYRVRVSEPMTLSTAVRHLHRQNGVVAAEPYRATATASAPDFQSASAMSRFLARLNSQDRERDEWREARDEIKDAGRRFGGTRHAEGDEGGADALGAYLYWFQQRAFPHDRIDWSAYGRAESHRDRMAPAQIGAQRGAITFQGLAPQWRNVGPTNFGAYAGPNAGRTNAVAIDPTNRNIIYAGTSNGGVWKTTDGGSTWAPLADQWPHMQVSDIEIDPKNPQTLYVGTGDRPFVGYGIGIMKSTDGGTTWKNISDPGFASSAVNHIIVDPDFPNILLAATTGYVWRSSDSGQTWKNVLSVSRLWQDAAYSIKDANGRFYYVVGRSAGGDFWRSPDRGLTWEKTSPPLGTGDQGGLDIATSPTNKSAVYLISYSDKKVFKSVDAGEQWTDVTNGLDKLADWSQGWYDLYLHVSNRTNDQTNPEDIFYVGLIDLLQSRNEASTYKSIGHVYQAGAVIHPDQHAMAVNANDFNDMVIANDGGVYRYIFTPDPTDPSKDTFTFTPLSANLITTEFYRGAFHPTLADYMMGGMQDNGTVHSFGNLSGWTSIFGGDGGFCTIAPQDPNIQTLSVQVQSSGGNTLIPIIRTKDGWASGADVTLNAGNDPAAFIPPHFVDPNNQAVIYAGSNYLYRWVEGKGWSSRLGDQSKNPAGSKLSAGSTISVIAIAIGDRNRVYTGAFDGDVYMTTDYGTSFTRLNGGTPALPTRSITSISINPKDENDILVGLSGFGTGHLWRCKNVRLVPRVWQDVSGTGANALPDIPLNAIARDPLAPADRIYVGTDIGVFMAKNGNGTDPAAVVWQNMTNPAGLPNVRVSQLETIAGTSYLNAVTYGRGIWRIPIDLPPTLVSLVINPTKLFEGQNASGTVQFDFMAPVGGAVVTLSSDNPAVAQVPASITIPVGKDVGTFKISTSSVPVDTKVTISATYGGITKTADLTVVAAVPKSLALKPSTASATVAVVGTLALNCPVAAPLTVNLVSSDTAVATVPATVSLQAGQQTVTFPVTVKDVLKYTLITISASARNTTVTAKLAVLPVMKSFTLDNARVCAGEAPNGTITLNFPAAAGGEVVALSSSNTIAATVPPTVTVPEGQTSVTFPVTTNFVNTDTSVVISATDRGLTFTAPVRITAIIPTTLSIDPNPVKGGDIANGVVALNCPAIGPGATITLQSSNPVVASVPNNVTVDPGSTGASFDISTTVVKTQTNVTITATYNGVAKTFVLTVLPATSVGGLSFNPAPACANSFTTATLALDVPAPVGGVTVALASSNTNLATVPASLFIPAGQSVRTFTVVTKDAKAPNNVATITAKYAGVTQSANLTITPTMLTSLTITPAVIKSGQSILLAVNLSCPAPPGGAQILLSSSYPAGLPLPPSVTVAAGSTAQTFILSTRSVASTVTVTVFGSYGGINQFAQFKLAP